jgi:formylglycine-generating enzyme required for sulfatase activity
MMQYSRSIIILSFAAGSFLSACNQRTQQTATSGKDSQPASCGTPHSRISALLGGGKATGNTLLKIGNGAFIPANTDTSKWPPKPWPQGMVWIAGGTYDMGGVGSYARKDEFPVHKVTVDGFWIDQTEVTNAAFKKFTADTKYVTTAEQKPKWEDIKKQVPAGTPKPDESVLVAGAMVFTPTSGPVDLHYYAQWWRWVPGADWKHPEGPQANIMNTTAYDNHPVVQVSWFDAEAFCKWSGKRLPTEAEWEYASRGGLNDKEYAWGDEAPDDDTKIKANIWQGSFPYNNTQKDGYVLTAPVGSFAPNGYGLYDMMGNVWEWCNDWYRPDTYSMEASHGIVKNPAGPNSSFDPDEPYAQKKVVRGGSFLCNASYCASYRPAARMKTSPDTGENHTGFRCAMTDHEWRNKLALAQK